MTGSWNDFRDLMSTLHTNNKFRFTVIGLQEIWNVPPNFNYELNGYKKFEFKIRDSTGLNSNAGGGVGLWVDSDFEYEVLNDLSIFIPKVFESIFIKVKMKKGKDKIIGNIYRPNSEPFADFQLFLDTLKKINNLITGNNIYK